MQLFIKQNHASIRINRHQLQYLKEYMHGNLTFPGDFELVSRGSAWFRLHSVKTVNSISNSLLFAIKVIKKALALHSRWVTEQLKILLAPPQIEIKLKRLEYVWNKKFHQSAH